MIGLTPILLTSSAESVKQAMENAIGTWQQYQKLCNSNAMMQSLIRSSSNQYLILDLEGRCHYSTINDEKEEEFIQSLQKELGKCRTSSRRSFFVTLGNQLYSVRSSLAEEGDFPYIIFRIMLSKIPLSHSKYGITIMDKEQALQSFIESFYSNTELSRSAAAAMDQSGSSSVPLMITGEIGTGKDRVAYLHYAKSQFNDEPLYVVNCSMLNDKTWNFLINHYNSPFTDNGNTIYISNLGVLSHPRQKQLLSIILDTNLHIRNRLIFSCTQAKDGHMPHAALEYTNMLGCVPLPIKPLREQKNDIVPSAALYIDTLNQNLGRQVVGLEDGAAKLLMEYDYPCNRTQFKRILKKQYWKPALPIYPVIPLKNIKRRICLFPDDHEAHMITHSKAATEKEGFSLNLEQPLDRINQDIVQHVLNSCNGNQTAAAKKLGISRTTLWRYINR